MGQEAVWNWMLLLLSNSLIITLKPPQRTQISRCLWTLVLKWKTYPVEGLFLFFLLLKGEREGRREIEGEKGIFRTSFSLLFSLLLVLPALNHLLVKNFSENSWSFFVFLQSSSAIIPDFVCRSRGQKGQGGKKKARGKHCWRRGQERGDPRDSCWRG